jgi:hypothetical protein
MNPNCDIGYHIWKTGPRYSECIVCHLVEPSTLARPAEPEEGGDRGGP